MLTPRASPLHASHRLVAYFTALAERSEHDGDSPAAVSWASVAAEFAWGINPGYYASRRLEGLLLRRAAALASERAGPALPPEGSRTRKRGIVHVMTRAYDIGGHTRVIERWASRASGTPHSLVVIAQEARALPSWVVAAVEGSGGGVRSLHALAPDERALALRRIWQDEATHVIDHCHPHDPTPSLAFGIPGGPPVLKFNAADHVFWLGASVADLVLELRDSGMRCTLRRRGARRSEILGIPLVMPPAAARAGPARRALGLPPGARVMVTIASAYKYLPLPPWSFCDLMEATLASCPEAHLVAVGPSREGAFATLATRFPDRVQVLGERKDIEPIYAAGDVYVDSLPFCSLTSSLDASLRGLPVHRYRNEQAPLLSNDDPAFDGQAAESTADAYVGALRRLIADPEEARRRGEQGREATSRTHASSDWDERAEALLSSASSHAAAPACGEEQAEPADHGMAEWQHAVGFLARSGIGVQEIKRSRAGLGLATRAGIVVQLLAAYPGYLPNARLVAQAAREFLRTRPASR